MYKLVILIGAQQDLLRFEQGWPLFLAQAEKMPGLRKEAHSQVAAKIYGDADVSMIHEMYFETKAEMEQAMASEEGQAAGRILQVITEGKVTLLFADHLEDDLEHIQSFDNQEENETDHAP